MKTIKQIYIIKAPLEKVWEALTDSNKINAWGGGPSSMEAIEKTEFSLWGGDIHGKNLKIIPTKKLVQEWYSGSWKDPSIVTFTLKKTSLGTELSLLQTKVPDTDAKDIDDGWNVYYCGAIKKYLEA